MTGLERPANNRDYVRLPRVHNNLFGLERFKAVGEVPLRGGEQQVRVELDYDGGGVGRGGKATLYVDGGEVASTRVDATVPAMFSADETTDLGGDTATA